MGRDRKKKHGVAVTGAWLPVALGFLRSRACAELSPHGAKLLIDLLALLGPNANGNGDLSLTPKAMAARGWTSRGTLRSAVLELTNHGLIAQTRQGSRLDCSLFAVTLFPIACDVDKLDSGPGCYTSRDWAAHGEDVPTEANPAVWRRARKTLLDDPPRNDAAQKRSVAEQTPAKKRQKTPTSFRHGTNPPVLDVACVPPRDTFIEMPSKGHEVTSHQPSAPTSPTPANQPAIESLAALWMVVGRRLPAWRVHPAGPKEAVSKATDRALHPLQHRDRAALELARAAQQRAIERHARHAPVLTDAGAACRLDERDDGTVVDRTEFAHESWED